MSSKFDRVGRTIESVYTGPVRKISEKIGLHTYATKTYLNILTPYQINIKNHTAEFYLFTTGDLVYFRECDERAILIDILEEIQTSDVFFDIGANVGLYSCFVSQFLSDGEVVAFEPVPETVERLHTNLELNNATNVTTVQKALSNTTGKAEMEIHGTRGSESQVVSKKNHADLEIDTIKGKDIINRNKIPEPTVMKIDVEGGEIDVLEGCGSFLADSDLRLIYCEVHKHKLPEDQDHTIVEDTLIKRGFEIAKIDESEHSYTIKAKKSSL